MDRWDGPKHEVSRLSREGARAPRRCLDIGSNMLLLFVVQCRYYTVFFLIIIEMMWCEYLYLKELLYIYFEVEFI